MANNYSQMYIQNDKIKWVKKKTQKENTHLTLV